MEETITESGFDMKRTIDWYTKHQDTLLASLPHDTDKKFLFPCENTEFLQLKPPFLSALVNCFPPNIRKLFKINKVIGCPKTWFHLDATGENPVLTTNIEEILSPTAIVPASYDTIEEGSLEGSIKLYEIDESACSAEITKIILAEAFVHELAHNLFDNIFSKEIKLKLIGGRIVSGMDFLLEFAGLVEKLAPITHYSSSYRDANNKFVKDLQNSHKTAISEEFAESITALLLGFAFCNDDDRGLNPFADRLEIRDTLRNLLTAEVEGIGDSH